MLENTQHFPRAPKIKILRGHGVFFSSFMVRNLHFLKATQPSPAQPSLAQLSLAELSLAQLSLAQLSLAQLSLAQLSRAQFS